MQWLSLKSYLRSFFCSAGPNGLNAANNTRRVFEFRSFHILIGKSAMAFLTGHLHLTIYSNPGTELWSPIQGFWRCFACGLKQSPKFGLWDNALPKVIFPFAGDNEWIVLFKGCKCMLKKLWELTISYL